MSQVLLTGDRPTGALHIGHYFGSLINRKKYEKDYQTFIMIADVQALTDNWDDPEKVRRNVWEVAADNIALGLDMDNTTLFIQSQIPQIAELTVFFSNLVTINRLKRNPTVKTEIEQKKDKFGQEGEGVTYGFLGYPVSQTGDITVVRANFVPVGVDQMPVLEQAQEIVDKFNRIYGQVFPKIEGKLSEAPRIIGLDGNSKMSKSLNNAVYLKDTPEITLEKIKSAKTDSESHLSFDPKNRPAISNLLLLYSLINNISIETAVADLQGIQYSAFKAKLGADMNNYFADFRQKREEIANNPTKIRAILEQGYARTLAKATETMSLVRQAMSINYY